MTRALRTLITACATIAMIAGFLTAPVAAATRGAAPQLTLLGTDTAEGYPFASVILHDQIYYVTEGDELAGIFIRRITAGRVTLSNGRVLTAPTPPQAADDGIPGTSLKQFRDPLDPRSVWQIG